MKSADTTSGTSMARIGSSPSDQQRGKSCRQRNSSGDINSKSSQRSINSQRSVNLLSLGSNLSLRSLGSNLSLRRSKVRQLKNAMQHEINRHRDSKRTSASPDTSEASSEESSYYIDEEESSWEEALDFRRNGCGGLFGDQSDVESTGDEQTRNSFSSVVTPRLGGGFKGCLCGMENEVESKESGIMDDGVKKRFDHQGQLDIYAHNGDVKSLRLRQYSNIPCPERYDHIVVKVEASTFSMQDYRTRPFEDVREHPVPGRQVMGRVQLVGGGQNEKKEMDIKVGDRIVALTPYGGNARYISIPVQSAILIPSHLRRFDIVCLVESYMSAYQMLNLGKKNRAGANIFIIGSSDPVGLAMVEMATRGGAIVYATSERCYRRNVTQLGATWLPNDPRAFSKLRGKMDVVIDTLCLDGYKSSHEALSLHGKLICTSNPPKHDDGSTFERMDRSWSKLCAKCIWSNVRFYDVHKSFQDDRQMFEQDFRDLLCKLRNGNIRPKIAGQICLNQVPESQRLMEKGLPNGTVIVLPWKKLDTTQHVPLEFVH